MVAATYDAAMIRVFADEGGYTNDPKDPGGATNWGITIFDARKYWKPDATAADVKAMPRSVAASIYRKHYAAPIYYDQLPPGVDYSVLDAAINSGIGRAIPWVGNAANRKLQTAAEAVVATNAAPDKVTLIQAYWGVRLSFLHGLKTWSHFGRGWGRRCANGEAAAVRMWLAFGEKLSSADSRKRLDDEAAKAKTVSRKLKTGTAGTIAGSGAGATEFNLSHLSLGGKVLLGIGIMLIIATVVVLVRKAIIHDQRAAAYASA